MHNSTAITSFSNLIQQMVDEENVRHENTISKLESLKQCHAEISHKNPTQPKESPPNNTHLNQQTTSKHPKNFKYSPDFHSVYHKEQLHSFTSSQAACVKLMFECWKNTTPEIGQEYILTSIDSNSNRLRDIFKNHPAWNNLIVPGKSKGNFRLNIEK